ncbi:PREDICTED: ribosomal L1 domain-containing protein 1-like [Camelina sativa]|uniref:Ribosomal L1 domain-containing protein 1-like n=1 Tax=Camelina sativa TaxID=90675 RepID=A0ABM0WS34_CAMSA|nr:PREDICTED: ribosomal L1 domain-containing protein 1-like [Camelina sativa]
MSTTSTMAALPPRNQSKVDPNNVNRAVKSLLKWWDSKSNKSQKNSELNENENENDGFVYLIVTVKRIPQLDRTNPIMIPLPHPLIDLSAEDSPELCLIIDDKHKNKITKEAALKKIEAEKIPITTVIKVSKLKSDLVKLEKEKRCCELYFAERRLMPVLPKLLGKEFAKKKKNPIAVNLRHGNWKEQIEKACESALFFVGTGTCSVVKVAKLSMGRKEIVENVMESVNGIGDSVPGKWKNVRFFHIKLLESMALPVYEQVGHP